MLSESKKIPYLLLTPGPLSTSQTVRNAMWFDSCTWDEDYKSVVTDIRKKLLSISNCDPAFYTTVLMQGSGTFGVESVLGSSVNKEKHKILFLSNGVYGQRMIQIARVLQLPHVVYEVQEHETFHDVDIKNILIADDTITHIAMVHCETTTGVLNNLAAVAFLAQQFKKYFIVDAMSSFGGIDFDITNLNIDFLISSANKCIQGVPGFSFIICKQTSLKNLCKDQAKSLALDLYGQWNAMENDPGKWRFTSPTHVVLAFQQALNEFIAEGGMTARSCRYRENQALLVEGMMSLGFKPYIARHLHSPIITTFIEPEFIPQTSVRFIFKDFYQFLKKFGFVIYPGKVTQRNTFRIGSIGHLFAEDIMRFLSEVEKYLYEHQALLASVR